MKYLALLLFAVLTTANTTEVIPYETLRDMYVKEEFFNSYGTLDSIRIFDKKLSAVDKEYQQQWTTEQIPILEDIKAKFLKLEDGAKDYTTLARCNNEGRNALCFQILARQEWPHRVIMRTDERILHLQHKAVTDDYAKKLHAKGMEHRTWRHELTLILVLVAFQTYLGMMIMRWGMARGFGLMEECLVAKAPFLGRRNRGESPAFCIVLVHFEDHVLRSQRLRVSG